MPLLLKLMCPPVGTATGLDCHQACRIICKERQHFITAQLDTLDPPSALINGMQLENLLGDVNANYAMFHGGFCSSGVCYPLSLWHLDAGGRRPYHLKKTS